MVHIDLWRKNLSLTLRKGGPPFKRCTSSSHYPWARQDDKLSSQVPTDQHRESDGSDAPSLPTADSDLQSGSQHNKGLDFRIHHYFDYIAGTSTGGLSAIMLSRLRMDIELALEQYDIVGKGVFSRPRKFSLMQVRRPKYRTSDMNGALQQVISNALPKSIPGGHPDRQFRARNSVKLQNDNQHACHTTVIAHCNTAPGTYMFRSYDHPDPRNGNTRETGHHLNPGPAHDTLLWEAARATSAAPGYFEKVQIGNVDYIDGGLGCNNPAMVAFKDVRQIHGMQPPVLVLSIGTGAPPTDQAPEPKSKGSTTMAHLKDMFMAFKSSLHLATDSEGVHEALLTQIKDIRRSTLTSKLHYYRFNVPDILDIELDEWSPRDGHTTKDKLRNATKEYLAREDVHQELVECAIELIKLRRARSATERWEQFATETLYKCTHKHLNHEVCETIPFDSRAKLRQHAFEMHGYVWRVTLDQGNLTSTQDQRTEGNPDGEKQSPCLPCNHHLCIWDECGQVKPVVFVGEADFLSHLRQSHGIDDPIIKTRHDLERWLDEGRTTMEQLKRQETDLKRRAKEQRVELMQEQLSGHSQDGLKTSSPV